jgi:hypothetical protein
MTIVISNQNMVTQNPRKRRSSQHVDSEFQKKTVRLIGRQIFLIAFVVPIVKSPKGRFLFLIQIQNSDGNNTWAEKVELFL